MIIHKMSSYECSTGTSWNGCLNMEPAIGLVKSSQKSICEDWRSWSFVTILISNYINNIQSNKMRYRVFICVYVCISIYIYVTYIYICIYMSYTDKKYLYSIESQEISLQSINSCGLFPFSLSPRGLPWHPCPKGWRA